MARFGDILSKKKAVGRILNYYLNVEGKILQSDSDYAIEIQLDVLSKTKHVIGICSSNINPKVLAGALRTGLIDYLIEPEDAIKAVISLCE